MIFLLPALKEGWKVGSVLVLFLDDAVHLPHRRAARGCRPYPGKGHRWLLLLFRPVVCDVLGCSRNTLLAFSCQRREQSFTLKCWDAESAYRREV